jgi:hypothetical protein
MTGTPRSGADGGGLSSVAHAIPEVVDTAAELQKSPDRNPYATEIAIREETTSQGASPLPRAELVGKKGFVLSRISFRTIVMKKWKQTFWVQYGKHTVRGFGVWQH